MSMKQKLLPGGDNPGRRVGRIAALALQKVIILERGNVGFCSNK